MMGIDLLLDAAKYVEYQSMLMSVAAGDHVDAKRIALAHVPFLHEAKLHENTKPSNDTNNNELVPVPIPGPSMRNTKKASPEPEPQPQILKKIIRNKAQLRRHCEQVKVQRAQLKECLEILRNILLPQLKADGETGEPYGKRRCMSTYSVLMKAKKEILGLAEKENEYLNEIEKLRGKNQDLKERLMAFGKENEKGTGATMTDNDLKGIKKELKDEGAMIIDEENNVCDK